MTRSKVISFFSYLLPIVFGVYPLIPERHENLSGVIAVICSLGLLICHNWNLKRITKHHVILIFPFAVFLFSAILSENHTLAFKKIETMFSLFLFPLIFYLGSNNSNFHKQKRVFFITYYLSNIFFCFCSVFIFSTYVNSRYPNKDANFFRMALQENQFIGDHPIYISIFLSIALLIGFLFLRTLESRRLKIGLIICQCFLFIMIIILMSKGVILGLLSSLFILFIYEFRVRKRYIFAFLFGCGIIASGILIPSRSNRFAQLFATETYTTLDQNNSTSIRIGIIKCDFQSVLESPIFGYGIGDVQSQLDSCYESNNLGLKAGQYNSHNQYFFVWLSAGILGLSLFLYWLYYYLRFAIKSNDWLMLAIIILYAVVFLFENVLSRQSGVVFFCFIINFLMADKIIETQLVNENSKKNAKKI